MNHQDLELFWLRSPHLIHHPLWWLSLLSGHCVSCNRNSFLVDLYSQKIINLRHKNTWGYTEQNKTRGIKYFLVVAILSSRWWVDNIIKCHGNTSISGGAAPQDNYAAPLSTKGCGSLNKGVRLSTPVCHPSAGRDHAQIFDRHPPHKETVYN